jgi:hypothetical protein
MKYKLPVSLPSGPLLIVGKPSSFQTSIAQTFLGHKFAAGNCNIIYCTCSATDGQEHIADMRNWLDEVGSNISRKQIESGINYIDNADAMRASALAEKIYQTARLDHIVVVRDTSREFGDAHNHWAHFHDAILAKTRCTIVHIAKTDQMGANGPDESKYKHVWRVAPWRASLHDQLNECVAVERISEGQQLTPWVFREHPGTAARIWKLSDEVPEAA